jgi:hypothetical protein
MAKAKIELVAIDGSGDAIHFFTLQEVESFGFKSLDEFGLIAVLCIFRVRVENQIFPLRVWFKRDEVAEENWLSHARKLATDAIMWTNETLHAG